MSRERIFSFALRVVCFAYGIASLVFAVYILSEGVGMRLPATLDPSMVISPSWTAIGIVSQAIVFCAFLTALAESFAEEATEDQVGAVEISPAPDTMTTAAKPSAPKSAASGTLVDAQNQLIA